MKHIVLKINMLILAAALCLLGGCSDAKSVASSQTESTKPAVTSSTSSSQKVSQNIKDNTSKKADEKPKVSEKSPSKPASKTVTITIDASKSKTKAFTLSSKKVEIKADESVFDALKSCCEANNIKLITSGLSNAVYVSSINGASEFGNGSQSGWIYSVNGKIASVGCGNYKLTGGETIKWMYTLDMGRSEAKSQ